MWTLLENYYYWSLNGGIIRLEPKFFNEKSPKDYIKTHSNYDLLKKLTSKAQNKGIIPPLEQNWSAFKSHSYVKKPGDIRL